MKNVYDKNELNFALIWIAIYVVLYSVADSISATIGTAKLITAPVCIVLTVLLYLWIKKYNLKEKYGICAFTGDMKAYVYFIPLIIIVSSNLWRGVCLNLTIIESVFYVISMLCVGFLEEVIFRGFLFKALCKDNVKQAIIISSITFGLGHIVNLLNGSDMLKTLIQVFYAIAIGFLFTIIFYKGKSLWPCIIAHSVINSLSAFANGNGMAIHMHLVRSIVLCILCVGYALYILKKAEKD